MYRPINEGAGGSGKEFSLSLGGNSPKEQFTGRQVICGQIFLLFREPFTLWDSTFDAKINSGLPGRVCLTG